MWVINTYKIALWLLQAVYLLSHNPKCNKGSVLTYSQSCEGGLFYHVIIALKKIILEDNYLKEIILWDNYLKANIRW